MHRTRLFAAVAATVLALTWTAGASGVEKQSTSPSHDGVVLVRFDTQTVGDRKLADFLASFMVDLDRAAAHIPIFDVNGTIYADYCYPVILVSVYYEVRGSEQAFRAQTEHLIRAISALPGVKDVGLYAGGSGQNAGEPCLQSYASWPAGATPGAEEGRPNLALPVHPIAISPNPSRGDVEFHYAVSGAGGESSVEVFDVVGRRVAEIFRGPRAPGDWIARWQATDAQGRRVPQGTYFVLVRSGDRATIGRFVITQ